MDKYSQIFRDKITSSLQRSRRPNSYKHYINGIGKYVFRYMLHSKKDYHEQQLSFNLYPYHLSGQPLEFIIRNLKTNILNLYPYHSHVSR